MLHEPRKTLLERNGSLAERSERRSEKMTPLRWNVAEKKSSS
jgi:hypothetical protein